MSLADSDNVSNDLSNIHQLMSPPRISSNLSSCQIERNHASSQGKLNSKTENYFQIHYV